MVGIMDVREAYAGLVAPHVESFNRMMQYDLDDAINRCVSLIARVYRTCMPRRLPRRMAPTMSEGH